MDFSLYLAGEFLVADEGHVGADDASDCDVDLVRVASEIAAKDKDLGDALGAGLGRRHGADGGGFVGGHGIVGKDQREASSPSFFNADEVTVVIKYALELVRNKKLRVGTLCCQSSVYGV